MNKHLSLPDVIDKCHRFRALDKDGLYALAKDLARLTADSFNVDAIKSLILSTTETKKLGTLKSVEKLLAQKTDPQIARTIMGKLVGIYELRLGDAHLPSLAKLKEAKALIGIKSDDPFPIQGKQLIKACVDSLYEISNVLNDGNPLNL